MRKVCATSDVKCDVNAIIVFQWLTAFSGTSWLNIKSIWSLCRRNLFCCFLGCLFVLYVCLLIRFVFAWVPVTFLGGPCFQVTGTDCALHLCAAREAQAEALRKFCHPCIVTIFEAFASPHKTTIITEYAGVTIDRIKPPPPESRHCMCFSIVLCRPTSRRRRRWAGKAATGPTHIPGCGSVARPGWFFFKLFRKTFSMQR